CTPLRGYNHEPVTARLKALLQARHLPRWAQRPSLRILQARRECAVEAVEIEAVNAAGLDRDRYDCTAACNEAGASTAPRREQAGFLERRGRGDEADMACRVLRCDGHAIDAGAQIGLQQRIMTGSIVRRASEIRYKGRRHLCRSLQAAKRFHAIETTLLHLQDHTTPLIPRQIKETRLAGS